MSRPLRVMALTALLGLSPTLAQIPTTPNIVNVPSTPALSPEQERQVQRIGTKIHCPICSGESIAQSQTDISRQMMNEVRELLRQGKTEPEILAQFASSYGESILREPPKSGINWLLWGLPAGGLLLGALLWWRFLQQASRVPEQPLSPEDEARIAALVAQAQSQKEQA